MLNRVEASRDAATGRQIAVASTTSSEVMYVVPAGKTFVGLVWGDNGTASFSVNGVTFSLYVGSTGANSTPFPVTFMAGTVIRNESSPRMHILGVEQ